MNIAYLIAGVLIILILGMWLWQYKIKKYLAKSAIESVLQDHPEWKHLKKIERLLSALYENLDPTLISIYERKRLALNDDIYTYGEIDFLAFLTLLEEIKPQPGEIFYDLGSGSGRAVFAAGLAHDLKKACGIEILPALATTASLKIEEAKVLMKRHIDQVYLKRLATIQFLQGDFLHYDFSDGDIIYISATCFSYPLWEQIIEKLIQLKPGSRVIVATKKIQHPQFELLQESNRLMSWGINSVNIYRKIA